MDDWEKLLWIACVAEFHRSEEMRAPACALFGWDYERFDLALGTLRRQLRHREITE